MLQPLTCSQRACCSPSPASSALIAVCWKGSSLKGYSLAGATVETGGRVEPSMPGGQATSWVQDLPSHSTRLAPWGRTATLSSARRRDLVAGASGSSGRSSLRLMTSSPAKDLRLSICTVESRMSDAARRSTPTLTCMPLRATQHTLRHTSLQIKSHYAQTKVEIAAIPGSYCMK